MPENTGRPGALSFLNGLSLAESRAGVAFDAWADVTPDEDLARALRLVAARERSHGEVIARRIRELGFDLRIRPDRDAAEFLARVADPRISDDEKVGPEGDGGDVYASIRKQVTDGFFDPLTTQLMIWFLAEETDSGDVLRDAYARVRQRAAASSRQ
jgi:hypothetical protein